MKKSKFITTLKINICRNLLCGLLFTSSFSSNADEISLANAIDQAQRNDPWLVENQFLQDALESKSVAAGTLPDPTVSLGLINLNTDSFDFNENPMTQLRVGISQMFPRGDTLQLSTEKLLLLSEQNPHLRSDRKAQLSVMVTDLWLDVFNAKESIRLIDKNRELFEQLVDISEANYSSAYGNTQQQDVVRAQLELIRLDDRLTDLKQQQEVAQKRLTQWVSGQFVEHYAGSDSSNTVNSKIDIDDTSLPRLVLVHPDLMDIESTELPDVLTDYLVQHPSITALETRIKASDTEVEITKQKYKSQWGINAGYGYRDSDPQGVSRSDLFSMGVNFDLPIFTENRQDKQVQAAVSESEAVKTQKWLLLRKMIAAFEAGRVQLNRLEQRHQLYQQQLLPQIYGQAEAALTAYTNDEGDFAEVVRARIDALDAEIDNIGIEVNRQKTISQLNYYLVSDGDSDAAPKDREN